MADRTKMINDVMGYTPTLDKKKKKNRTKKTKFPEVLGSHTANPPLDKKTIRAGSGTTNRSELVSQAIQSAQNSGTGKKRKLF